MTKTNVFLLIGGFVVANGLSSAFGYFYAKRRILRQSKGELVVEDLGAGDLNLYLKFASDKDLNSVRTAECIVCKIVKTNDVSTPTFKFEENNQAIIKHRS